MRRRTPILLAVMATSLVLSSGVALAATIQCETYDPNTNTGICYGTQNADTLKGTDGKDIMIGLGGGDTLEGFGGDDILDGRSGRDNLLGGPGDDIFSGGGGRDMLSGGDGEDDYLFDNHWGKDRIVDVAIPDNDPFTGNELDFGQIDAGTTRLTIRLSSGPGPEVRNASGTSTVNWDGDVIDIVWGGEGDDLITGNDAANLIRGSHNEACGFCAPGRDADTISSGEGDDFVDVSDGSGGDTVDCGGGNDTVQFDLGDTVSSNCEVQQASSAGGGVA